MISEGRLIYKKSSIDDESKVVFVLFGKSNVCYRNVGLHSLRICQGSVVLATLIIIDVGSGDEVLKISTTGQRSVVLGAPMTIVVPAGDQKISRLTTCQVRWCLQHQRYWKLETGAYFLTLLEIKPSELAMRQHGLKSITQICGRRSYYLAYLGHRRLSG